MATYQENKSYMGGKEGGSIAYRWDARDDINRKVGPKPVSGRKPRPIFEKAYFTEQSAVE